MDVMTTGVIVPSCDDRELLSRLVESLYSANPGAPFSLLVIDDMSRSIPHKKYLGYLSNYATVMANQEKLYFTKTSNQGIQYFMEKGYNFFFLLNSDCVVTDFWLEALLEQALKKDNGIVGSTLLNPDGTTLQHLGGYGQGQHFNIDKPWVSRLLPRRVPWVTGAAMMLRRDVVERVGYLPTTSPPRQYDFSDRNYCVNARYSGYEIAIATRSIIYHFTHKARELRQ